MAITVGKTIKSKIMHLNFCLLTVDLLLTCGSRFVPDTEAPIVFSLK